MSGRRYFTLCTRDGREEPWAPQFGDYDFKVVAEERDEYVRHGSPSWCLAIVASGDDQASIDARVAALNESGI